MALAAKSTVLVPKSTVLVPKSTLLGACSCHTRGSRAIACALVFHAPRVQNARLRARPASLVDARGGGGPRGSRAARRPHKQPVAAGRAERLADPLFFLLDRWRLARVAGARSPPAICLPLRTRSERVASTRASPTFGVRRRRSTGGVEWASGATLGIHGRRGASFLSAVASDKYARAGASNLWGLGQRPSTEHRSSDSVLLAQSTCS